MEEEQSGTYEKLYFAMWEIGQRYGELVQFRVIGRSHDDRMIPLEYLYSLKLLLTPCPVTL